MRAYSKVFAIYLVCAALLTWMLFAFGLVELMELPGFEGANAPSKPTITITERAPDPPLPEKASRPRAPDVASVPTDRLHLPGPVPPSSRDPEPRNPPKVETKSAPVTAVVKPEPAPAPPPPVQPRSEPVATPPPRIETRQPVEIEVAKVPESAPPPAAPAAPAVKEAARAAPPTAVSPPPPPVEPPKTVVAPPPAPPAPAKIVAAPPPPAPPKTVVAPPPPSAPPRTVELAPTPPPQRPAPVVEATPQTRAAPSKWAPLRRIAGFGADALVEQMEDPRRPADDLPCVVFEQMKFKAGTAQPTNGTTRQIALIAEALGAHPPVSVEIGSRIGTNRLTAANINLSVERAAYVRSAIMARGVPVARMALDTEASYHILMDDLGRLGMARAPSIGVCIRSATS